MGSAPESYAISFSDIEAAYSRLQELVHRTPVLTSDSIDCLLKDEKQKIDKEEEQQRRAFFKCELFQKTGSFKVRGALNAALTKGKEAETFVAHSSGNHAQAVALAAKLLGKKAITVMPQNSNESKKIATKSYGATVVLSENTNADRERVSREQLDSHPGAVLIHPSNDPETMAGQGTVGIEFLDQMKELGEALDAIIVPVGGGGLSSGIALAAKHLQPGIKIIGAEPAGAADAYCSLLAGDLRGHSTPPKTIADGLRSTLGSNTFPVLRDFMDRIVTVEEEEIIAAMKLIWERMKITIEPSAAVGVAVLLKLPQVDPEGELKNIGVILCGGNIDVMAPLPWQTIH